jgi:hypothetical protein
MTILFLSSQSDSPEALPFFSQDTEQETIVAKLRVGKCQEAPFLLVDHSLPPNSFKIISLHYDSNDGNS